MTEEDRWIRLRRRTKIRRIRILARTYFLGLEKRILELLLGSAVPVEDAEETFGIDRRGVYRRIQHLTRLMVIYDEYFAKKTYKQAKKSLRDLLTPMNFAVVDTYLRCRNNCTVAKHLGITELPVRKRIRVIEGRLRRYSRRLPEIADFLEFWLAVRHVVRSYDETW